MQEGKLVYDHLEFAPGWLVQSGLNVNPIPPDSFNVEQATDALEIYIAGPAGGGALATQKLPIDTTRPYVGLDLEVYFSETAARLIRCCELDVKGAHQKRIFNWSSQNNQGAMQMVPAGAGKWTNIGFTPGQPAANTWVSYSFRYWADFTNFLYTYKSVTVGPVSFVPGTAFQGLTCPADDWEDVLAIQLQPVLNAVAGAFSMRYRNITLTQCAAPF